MGSKDTKRPAPKKDVARAKNPQSVKPSKGQTHKTATWAGR